MPTGTQRKTSAKRKAPDTSQVLDRLARMINRADDFVLGFVKCNHPLQQKELRREFLAGLGNKRVLEVELDKPLVSLLDELTAHWDPNSPPDVVCVYGLEKSINELQEASPVLGRLNNDRDLLRRSVPVPLLIWLPDFALDFIARGAPDFWAWRSGVYEFATERLLWEQEGFGAIAPDPLILASLNAGDKNREIARLEELLRTASSLQKQGGREKKLVAGLLFQLGVLYAQLGEQDIAMDYYQRCRKIGVELGDSRIVGRSLHEIARVKQFQGDYGEATLLYQQSLDIAEESDDKINIASTLHNLGLLKQSQGFLEEAAQLYQQSLSIKKTLDNNYGMANSLQQLGVLQHELGNLENAEHLYQQSLKIREQTSDKGATASNLHLLAMLQQDRGNFEEAERLYETSLTLSKELGDKSNLATTQAQIGLLQEVQGKLGEALHSYVTAWLLFTDLHSPLSDRIRLNIGYIREQVGSEQFNEWLTEDFGPQPTVIRRKLDEALSVPIDAVQQEPESVG